MVRAPMEEEDQAAEGGGAESKGDGGGEKSRSAFARWAVGCGGCGCRQLVELIAKSARLPRLVISIEGGGEGGRRRE